MVKKKTKATKEKSTEETTLVKKKKKKKPVKEKKEKTKPSKPIAFTDDDVDALDPLEAIRQAYDMYVGSSDPTTQLFAEAIDNSVDEFMNGYGKTIRVYIDTEENRLTIRDEGRGLPLGMNEKLNQPTMQVLLTHVHSGAKYRKNVVKTSGGKNGVGIKCITALSKFLTATSIRDEDGVRLKGSMSFEQSNIVEEFNIKKIKKTSKNYVGTTLSFVPDDELFGTELATFDIKKIAELIDLKCYLNAGLKVEYTVDDNETVTYYHKNGILDFINKNNTNPLFNMDTIVINEKDDDGNSYEIVMSYNNDTDENITSYVNSLPLPDGGTLETGFKKGLTRVFLDYIKNNNLLTGKDKNLTIKGEDIRRGLVCIMSLHHSNPRYSGQTKDKLSNREVDPIVNKIIYENMDEWLQKNPKLAKKIAERIVAFSKATNSAKEKMKKIVTVNQNSAGLEVTEKFMDCESDNPDEVEIFVVEGDSAGSGVENGRDYRYQAIYPLRGKILNTNSATNSTIMDNKELNEFLKIEFGTNDLKAIKETLRRIKEGETELESTIKSKKIIILTDSDADGDHICILFINFIYEHLSDMIDLGWLYIGSSPLYRVNVKGKWKYYENDSQYLEFVDEIISEKYKVVSKTITTRSILNHSEEFVDEFKRLLSKYNIHKDVLSTFYHSTDIKEIKAELKSKFKFKVYKSKTVEGLYDSVWHEFNYAELYKEMRYLRSIYKGITSLKLLDKSTKEKTVYEVYDAINIMNSSFKYTRNRIKGEPLPFVLAS